MALKGNGETALTDVLKKKPSIQSLSDGVFFLFGALDCSFHFTFHSFSPFAFSLSVTFFIFVFHHCFLLHSMLLQR